MPPTIEKPGFSAPSSSWDEYIRYRPAYPPSFWNRIYNYHSSHLGQFGVAHDVGAGAGIASQDLARNFEKVIVSDPNDNYTTIASVRLITQSGYPKEKFTFMQERGEESSVESATVDLLVVCEAIHWMEIDVVMKEFARQVKPGGTLAISHYGRPVMVDNVAAQGVWDRMFDVWGERNFYRDEVHTRTIRNGVTGLDVIPFSMDHWEEGVRRVWINTRGKDDAFSMSVKHTDPFPSRVGEGDVREWIEDDGDWVDEKDVQWLKGLFASFIPTIPEDEIKELWDEMEDVVGKGKKVRFAWPIVQLIARRRQ
ncbi:S-adenosyl-L-methionine-dependent methyltransferase [Leptodontidium sp. MPI-SDFR-AT-0119]|nr:S-adenosyl-L-methionine-dependent methyltransferase [Leptodontidium sp. MPI-SDFR-AT-0119]